MRTFIITLGATLVLAAGAAGTAHAKQHRFVGEHPGRDGVFCHINAPHVHVYAPTKVDVLYRQHDGWAHFVGDPVAHGYAGPKHAYHGAHPLHVDVYLGETEVDGDEVEYCYLRGPHYHVASPPPAAVEFQLRGGVYWYLGAFPPEFERGRPKLASVNVVYESIEYRRPIVVESPPPGWVDVLVVAAVPAPTAAVVIEATPPPPPRAEVHGGIGLGVHVEVPLPVLEVRVGGPPAVIVEEHHHHKHKHKHRDHDDDDDRGHWKHGKGKGKAKVKVGGGIKVKAKAKGRF